jgi:hypothetical protein
MADASTPQSSRGLTVSEVSSLAEQKAKDVLDSRISFVKSELQRSMKDQISEIVLQSTLNSSDALEAKMYS